MIRLLALGAAMICVSAFAAPERAAHSIAVRIEPQTRSLDGRDSIRLDTPRAVTLMLAAAMRVESIVADGYEVRAPASSPGRPQRIAIPAARRIEIRWRGTLGALDKNLDHRSTLTYNEAATGIAGTYLPAGSGWYPAVAGSLESYNLELDLPAGQKGLVPGKLVSEREANGRYRARFEFREAGEGIALMAGPYRIDERPLRTAIGTQVRLRTYFHPEIAELAPGYLDSIAGYLDLYERWIGAYPFSEFSVVSSPTPTGFGMPTLTYLGIDVLRLPFIRATSLGHEVLHNWWGNGVYPDYASGNWAEGLTTFMADYAYRERDSAEAAAAMRLGWLRDYAAMPPRDDLPLVRFTSRTHGATQVIGYHKAAMVFYMLRDAIDTPAFDEGLKIFWRKYRFKVASWDDLRRAFEQSSGKPLVKFFDQWLKRTGAPALHIANADAKPVAAGWRLNITLAQGAPPFLLSVPLTITTTHGELVRRADVSQDHETVTLDLPAEPLAIKLDPELQIFRRLGVAEAPPILRELILARSPAIAVLSKEPAIQAAAHELAARMLERPASDAASATSLLVVGLHAEIDAWLAGHNLARPATVAASKGSAQVWTTRDDSGKTVALVSVHDAAALAPLAGPLPHYGQQSYLVFEGARAIDRGIWPSQPQVWELRPANGAR